MAAVMQQQVRAPAAATVSRDPSRKITQYAVGPDAVPIRSRNVPHHRRQSELARHPQHIRTARPEWRTEEPDS